MTTAKRIAAWTGLFLQGWAIWAATAHSLPWLSVSPAGLASNLALIGVYLLGYTLA